MRRENIPWPAVIGLALAAVLLVSGIAQAKDTHAPPAARDRWLPCEPWVMYHWMPFNERHLYSITGIKRWQWKRYIRDDDHHTLGKLIKKHGKDPDTVVDALMQQWKGEVSGVQLTELRRRASELMTQGHLSQHAFFHYFHDPVLALNAKWVFGVRPADYHRARLRAFDPAAIAAHGGRSVKQAVRRAMVILRRSQRQGIHEGWTSRAQANVFLHQQRQWTSVWLKQDIHRGQANGFPHGTKAPRGSTTKRACTYMAGSDHPTGKHDHMNMSLYER